MPVSVRLPLRQVIITTVAGTGIQGFSGEGGPATQAEIYCPEGLAIDSADNLYIVDSENERIRKISATTGIITTVAGNGTQGGTGDGGPAINAEIAPNSLIVDGAGDLYIANYDQAHLFTSDGLNDAVRKVAAATGIITTIAGTGVPGFSGDGGPATSAELHSPSGMAFDSSGNLYITDSYNNRVREVSAATGIITTVAGKGPSYPAICSFSDGTLTGSDMCGPSDVAFDSAGNLYIVADDAVLEIHPAPSPLILPTVPVRTTSPTTVIPLDINVDGTIITSISVPVSQGGKQEYSVTNIGCALYTALAAGTECDVSITFSPAYPGERPMPLQVNTSAGVFDFGVMGTGTGLEVALTPGTITTVAGNGTPGFSGKGGSASGDGGPAISAEIFSPSGIALDSAGNLYISDTGNAAIRKVAASTGIIATVADNGTAGYSGDGGLATNAQLQSNDITVDSAGNLYIGDTFNDAIRMVAANTGIITTVAGNGTQGYSGDGGPATSAELSLPGNVAFDRAGNLYFPDTVNNRVREVTAATGVITTVAGNGAPGFSGDGGSAASAELYQPVSIAFDSMNNLYISDTDNNVIRKVTAGTGVITTVAGNGAPGYSGDGGPATSASLHFPGPIALDSANNLYISDGNNNRIREVTAGTKIITTVAGNGAKKFGGDGGSATAAEMSEPYGIALDSSGNLYIADGSNNRIRAVNVLASTLNYASTPVGTTSADSPQTATMTNIGNDRLAFSGLMSGLNPTISNSSFMLDKGSSCPQLDPTSPPVFLGSGDFCTLLISFTPTSPGVNTGTATITDDALNTMSTQVIHLNEIGASTGTGTGAGNTGDFTLSATPSTQSISPGSSATYTLSVSGTGGFTGPVTLTATGMPPGATLNLNPTATISGSTPTTATLTIVTASKQARLIPAGNHLPRRDSRIRYGLLLLPLPLLGLARLRKRLRAAPHALLLFVLTLLSLGAMTTNLSGCANVGIEAQSQNYTVTITGTSGSLQHSVPVTLTIENYKQLTY